METFLFIVTIFALYGAYLNSCNNWVGFWIWTVTNVIFAYHNYTINEYSQMSLFLAYFFISLNGIRNSL
jgi:hypothetical protein